MSEAGRGGAQPPALLLYNALLLGSLPVLAPYLVWRSVRLQRLRTGWAERLGHLPPAVEARAGRRRLVWFHAVSVGEVVAAAPIVHEFRRLCPQAALIFSTVTETGRRTAEARLPDPETLFYLPWDFPFIIRPVIERLRPALLVTIETERWPNLLYFARHAGARTALANGRISDRSFARLARLPLRPLSPELFHLYDRCCMQSRQDAERARQLGAPPERVVMTGNAKVDVALPQAASADTPALAEELGIDPAAPVLVAGSTAPGEEEVLLRAFGQLRETFPHARLLLAPRQKERAGEVAALARQQSFPVVLRTELPGRQVYSAYERAVVVVDTMGELARLYGLATVAFVGRSLVPMGGSNLLEALSYGRPVLVGPHMENFAEMAGLARENGLAFTVTDAADITRHFTRWCTDNAALRAFAGRSLEFLEAQRGAARRTAGELAELLEDAERTCCARE